LASNFNDDLTNDFRHRSAGVPADPAGARAPEPVTPPPAATPLVSEAVIKFRSCRWRRPPDEGTECCGHRDVLPIAGSTSFDPEAWCPDCAFFKLRRTPKKREEMHRY
jgi:hypothetical protein